MVYRFLFVALGFLFVDEWMNKGIENMTSHKASSDGKYSR